MTFLRNILNVSIICFSCLLCIPATQAGEVVHSYVDYQQGHYLLNLEMRIHAPIVNVYAVLLDFNALTELNDSIKVSQLLLKQKNEYTVLLETKGCVWFFCRRIKQIQVVTEMGNGYLQSVTDPKQSDMAYGKVLWHVRPDQQNTELTLITYSADFEPDFFVPPLIGPWIMKRRLLKEGRKTVNGIERKAQHAPR